MISTAYHYYLTTYANPKASRYDTHKKSDLRSVYDSMVSLNKKSPLYKIDLSDRMQYFMIDLKEYSRSYKNNLLETLKDSDGGSIFATKHAYSSDESVLNAICVSEEFQGISENTSFEIAVQNLAKAQINTGDYVPSNRLDLSPGEYAFDLSIGDISYQLEFKVRDSSTNLKVQEKLARLINRSNIGLHAEVLKDSNGSSALRMTALQTGSIGTQEQMFRISDNFVDKMSGCVSLFGLDQVSQFPSDAQITVDGDSRSASSNLLSIGGMYSIQLNQVTAPEQTVQVGMKSSIDTIIKNISSMTDGFNSLYDLTAKYTPYFSDNKLAHDMLYLTKRFRTALEGSGILLSEDGRLRPDEALIVQSYEDGSLEANNSQISLFKDTLLRQLDLISLNPIAYMNKKMIAYPNPVRSFPSIYQSSIYSGMIFNGYI